MKFDMLCNIILEGKKQQQFARINITNPSPTFSIDDVLRDPNDPSRGVKTYLDEQLKGSESGEPVDEERIARRALRRLNWVVGTLIKRVGTRELDLRKLHLNIIILLEKYLTNVLRYSDEQVEKMELKTAKEAAFIGSLLLPPTERLPNAKGVFTIAKDSIEMKPSKGQEEEYNTSIADRLAKEFNMTVDEYIAAFDPDLIDTIKTVIRDGMAAPEEAPIETTDEEPGNFDDGLDVEDEEVPTGAIGAKAGRKSVLQDVMQEIFDAPDVETIKQIATNKLQGSKIPDGQKRAILHNINTINDVTKLKTYLMNSMFSRLGLGSNNRNSFGESVKKKSNIHESVSVSQILKDPRIKNVYDPRIVRKVLKSMVSLGSIAADESGNLTLTEPGSEDWRIGLNRARNKGVDTDNPPPEEDIKDLAQTFDGDEKGPSDSELSEIESEDEEDIDINKEAGISARRLGYKKPSNIPEDEDEDDSTDDEKPWYK